jgi:hypothetical protein
VSRKIGTALGVGLFATVLLSGVALGQGVTGGCTGTVNGRSPASMTADDPLIVHKDERVAISGQLPPSAQAAGRSARSRTTVYVDIFGFPVKIRTVNAKGPSWGGNVELPKLIRDLAVGVYRVSGDATGSPGGWKCEGSAFIKLDGNPLTKPATYVGAGVGVAGAAAGLRGRRRKPNTDPNKGGREIVNMIKEMARDGQKDLIADFVWLIALVICLVLGGAFFAMGMAVPAGAAGDGTWVRGRPVRGLLGGLVLGLGSAIVLQQFAVLALDSQALLGVAGVAVVTAARAWVGTPYKRNIATVTASTGAVPPAPPPTEGG